MTYLGLLRGDEPLTPADRDNIANLIVSQVHHIHRVEAEAGDLRARNMSLTLDSNDLRARCAWLMRDSDKAQAEIARLREVVSVGSARVLCRGHWDAPDDENYGDLGCPICIRNEGTMYRHGLEAAVEVINNESDTAPITIEFFLPKDRVRPWEGEKS
jgi:hypothetical protein